MLTEHHLTITAKCPADKGPDNYACVVRTHRVIPVEQITAAVLRLAAREAFQEELTAELARELGCEVATTGYHSNVRTVCTAGTP